MERNSKWVPGHGGMKCRCCVLAHPSRVKPRLARDLRRKARLALRIVVRNGTASED